MKIISPSADLINIEDISRSQLMEKCGRLCYKSENKITDKSAERFITNTIKKGHWSVTEFAVFTMEIYCIGSLIDELLSYERKYLIVDRLDQSTVLVTGTARAIREFYQRNPDCIIAREIVIQLYGYEPGVVRDYHCMFKDIDILPNSRSGYFKIDINILKPEHIDELSINLKKRHRFALVWFIVSRAVSHELVRHRPVSWLQESQRYCRYSDDKFGNEVTFIEPGGAFEDLKGNTGKRVVWRQTLETCEKEYLGLLKAGCSPQCARLVLPNSCKTELVMMATLEEFEIFFGLRTSSKAEPSMREVVRPLYGQFNERWPSIFPLIEFE